MAVEVRNAKEVPPSTEITDEDLINEMHDIKINSVSTRFRSSPALHPGLIRRFKSEKGVALANNIRPTSTQNPTTITDTGSSGGGLVV